MAQSDGELQVVSFQDAGPLQTAAREAECLKTLKLLVRAIVELWKGDPSAPSITLSFLPDHGEWYASIVRYREKYGMAKQVMVNVTGESLEAVVLRLAQLFIDATGLR